MQIYEWVELINMLHVENFIPMVAELREKCQENERNSSPVLIIYHTLQVPIHPNNCMLNVRHAELCHGSWNPVHPLNT